MSRPKYRPAPAIPMEHRDWPSRRIETPPVWASVDLRDGNQAFVRPMRAARKLEYFRMLIAIGFKEIEVAYPAASQDEFEFVRRLIGEGEIPADVEIGVFTAAKRPLIERTMASIAGVERAIVHCYLASSELHRHFVFGKSAAEVKQMAVDGTRMIADAVADAGLRDRIRYEFSPEEFSDTEPAFAVELAAAVREAWGRGGADDFILNLPATVERRPPYEYADLIEHFARTYPYLDETVLSIHVHNDQGCALAAAEMAVLAGARRVEGTLLGHGERAGNLDLIAFALNLQSRGVATGLDFSRLPEIAGFIEAVSGLAVPPRQPYAGELAFTAFSGTHQDAIGKCMARRDEVCDHFDVGWKMPYLHLDPADIGRSGDGVVRINSQSGKGGIAYVLEKSRGIRLPPSLRADLARAVQRRAEQCGGEIRPEEIFDLFLAKIVYQPGRIRLIDFTHRSDPAGRVDGVLHLAIDGRSATLHGSGNGPVEAAAAALGSAAAVPPFEIVDYTEKALAPGADADAIALVTINLRHDGRTLEGVGIDGNIDLAAVKAVIHALNRAMTA